MPSSRSESHALTSKNGLATQQHPKKRKLFETLSVQVPTHLELQQNQTTSHTASETKFQLLTVATVSQSPRRIWLAVFSKFCSNSCLCERCSVLDLAAPDPELLSPPASSTRSIDGGWGGGVDDGEVAQQVQAALRHDHSCFHGWCSSHPCCRSRPFSWMQLRSQGEKTKCADLLQIALTCIQTFCHRSRTPSIGPHVLQGKDRPP